MVERGVQKRFSSLEFMLAQAGQREHAGLQANGKQYVALLRDRQTLFEVVACDGQSKQVEIQRAQRYACGAQPLGMLDLFGNLEPTMRQRQRTPVVPLRAEADAQRNHG